MSHDATLVRRFRTWAVAEGISFLLLLLIAMPIKYGLGIEWPVKVVGWIHGVLFIGYCYYVARCWRASGWSFGFAVLAFVAALLPFGPFVLDRRLPRQQETAPGAAAN